MNDPSFGGNATAAGAVLLLALTLAGTYLMGVPRMGPAWAQGARDSAALVARGRVIAAGRCAQCHAISRAGESPQRGVIPFRDLHERFPIAMLLEAQRIGIVSGHDEMPMTALDRGDAEALLALIDSLAPAGAPRYLDMKSSGAR